MILEETGKEKYSRKQYHKPDRMTDKEMQRCCDKHLFIKGWNLNYVVNSKIFKYNSEKFVILNLIMLWY